jgi:hypothetical protein
VLEQRAREIMARDFLHRLGDGGWRQQRIQPRQRRSQVAREHHLARVRAPQRAIRSERLLVPRIDTLPTQLIAQMPGERLLDEPVFAVDVGVGHGG